MRSYLLMVAGVALLLSCTPSGAPTTDGDQESEASRPSLETRNLAGPVDPGFGDYWYQGVAEITSYDLKQARYGEIHDGTAVMIFVTEDHSEGKQVKLDDPDAEGNDGLKVLKLNITRDFNTGIYPYSMMTSVFTPVNRVSHPRSLKVTTSSQEWCGQTFVQMNLTDYGYRSRMYSYFESEGDVVADLEDVLLEDDLWTTIRLNPMDLPTGEFEMFPGTIYQRLRHTPFEAKEATANLRELRDRPGTMSYVLRYVETDRLLTIEFEKDFPHEITGWEDRYRSGWGANARGLTTRATMKKRILVDYWTKNSVADLALRGELGLN